MPHIPSPPLAFLLSSSIGLAACGSAALEPFPPADAGFAPSADEVEWSKKIITAHAEAMKEGKGVAVFEGKLIENLHVENAQRIVALSEAIASRDAANGQTQGAA